MKLFEDKVRTDTNPKKKVEDLYFFYDRSAKEYSGNMRAMLNSWFQYYPECEKHEFVRDFKTGGFEARFFELLIHELFRRESKDLQIHPELPNNKKPDFIARGFDGDYYLEATIAKDKSKDQEGMDNRIDSIKDKINQLSDPYSLNVLSVAVKGKKQPAIRNLIVRLRELMATLKQDDFSKTEFGGFPSTKPIVVDVPDVVITVVFYWNPKKPRKSGSKVIGHEVRYLTGDSSEALKDKIASKAKHYGTLDKPLLLCVNSLSDKGTYPEDILTALFGDEVFTYNQDGDPDNDYLTRNPNGLFTQEANVKNVSAVLITIIDTGNLYRSKHWLVENPLATTKLDLDDLKLKKHVYEDGELKETDGLEIVDILDFESYGI